MRAIFSLVGLLVVVVVVGMLAKKQMHTEVGIQPVPQDSSTIILQTTAPDATVQQQSQQIQQQVKKAVEDSLQQTRAIPDDK